MNYKKYFIITVIFIIFILFYGIFTLISNNYNSYNLQDKSKDIIYSIVDNENKKVPYVNLEGGDSNIINEDIRLFVNEDLNLDSDIGYKYSKYGNILSLLIQITRPSYSNAPTILFKSYNILITNSKLVDNNELLSLMNSSNDTVDQIITNHFIDFYNDSEIRNFLEYEEYIQYRSHYFDKNQDIHYYLDNEKLYAYININNGMDYSEYDYLKQSDFRVMVGDYNG